MIGPETGAQSALTVRRACDELSRKLRAAIACRAEEFLAAEPSLASDSDAALELLYTEFVVREQLGQQPRVQEWLERFPQWQIELTQIFEVHEAVAQRGTRRVGLSGTQIEVCGPNDGGEDLAASLCSGYKILDEIGRGGMGVVYRARQLSLNRIVALKMLPSPGGQRERARFRTEAEATARLSHPNIVQIYEVWQEGERPFLSVEFVAGKSLDKELAAATLAPRAAAELVVTLARAVDYAHQQGIVHRDLKPANILLAADGTPKITDFGLAKTLGEDQTNAPSVAIVGTPSYMAPEQSQPGNTVGPPADVYALGAILYEALTGRRPFRGESALDVLEQVRSHEPLPPSRLAPKTPRDLETICLKCLAKQPGERYASASLLADDLERFLEGKPIFARPAGRLERAVRWCRRNPLVAGLTGGIALALVCGTVISSSLAVWALNEKYRAAEHARQATASAQQKQVARELAEYRFAQAEKAVEEYLDGIEKQERLKEADFLDLRKQLLGSAAPFYEEFVRQKPGDAKLEAKRGRAYRRLATLHNTIGEYDAALECYAQMQSTFEKLAAEDPSVFEYRYQLVRGHNEKGFLLRTMGRTADAEGEIHKVLNDSLPDEFLQRPEMCKELAWGHGHLGILLIDQGKFSESEAELRQALAIHAQLAADFPDVVDYRLDLAKCNQNLGLALNYQKKWKPAEATYRQALDIDERLAEQFPRSPTYRWARASLHNNLGTLLNDWTRLAESEEEFRRALEIQRRLVVEFPSVAAYRHDLSNTCLNLINVLERLGKSAEADVEYQEGLKLSTALVEQAPDLPANWSALAKTLHNRGIVSKNAGKLDEAREFFNQAIEHQLKAYRTAPNNPSYRLALFNHYHLLGDTVLLLKDHSAVAEAADHVAEIRPEVAVDAQLAARYFGRCVELVQQDANLSADEREALVQSYSARGIEQLREAVRRGYNDVAALKRLSALAPLRGQPEFQQLVQELERR
jgi:eukaryotic-like serine/threonine-protein kinase